jgi:hypothetical protein
MMMEHHAGVIENLDGERAGGAANPRHALS